MKSLRQAIDEVVTRILSNDLEGAFEVTDEGDFWSGDCNRGIGMDRLIDAIMEEIRKNAA